MRPVRIVAHTHWDREWYQTFEEFRRRLIPTLDAALDAVAEPTARFHLDGQTAMIDDYLSVRSERERDLRSAISDGRMSCGPFVTLVDTFLVSGESTVRNLEDGMARSQELGSTSTVAYQPDQFGHISQIPQILSRAGFDRVVVWRGVPKSVGGTGFTWASLDGSEIDAFYLPFGYGQGARLPRVPGELVERLEEECERTEPFLRDDETLLLTAGDDHEEPNPHLAALLGTLRSQGLDVEEASLEEHLATWIVPDHRVAGELRSAARANLLPSTYSVRPQQKVLRARAEHLLERYAEPLATLVMPDAWPVQELGDAWMCLHLNGAHDSVCGCSTDGVAADVDERTATATRLASDIAGRALARLAARVREPGSVAFNPSPFDRRGVPGLGWGSVDPDWNEVEPVAIVVRKDVARIDEAGISLRVEDQADAGDLYTFEEAGPVLGPQAAVESNGEAVFTFDRFDLSLAASRGEGDFIRFDARINNRAPDHRIRICLALPRSSSTSVAGSPFDIVERPVRGEGGYEPGSCLWPARGFVLAGGSGFLSEGVVEYELLGDELALTLMRCIGTISREHPLNARKVPAGPDVTTPGAQLIGDHHFSFGVFTCDPGDAVMEEWERFALPLMPGAAHGEGEGEASGRLLEVHGPALSSVRLSRGSLRVTMFNPFENERPFSVDGRSGVIRGHGIEVM